MTKVTNEEYENILSRLDSLEHNYERKTEIIPESEKKKIDANKATNEYLQYVSNNKMILTDDIYRSIHFYAYDVITFGYNGTLEIIIDDVDVDACVISTTIHADNIIINFDNYTNATFELKINGEAKITGLPLKVVYAGQTEPLCKK